MRKLDERAGPQLEVDSLLPKWTERKQAHTSFDIDAKNLGALTFREEGGREDGSTKQMV